MIEGNTQGKALLHQLFADGGEAFFKSLGMVNPGPCPAARRAPLAQEIMREFDRVRYLYRYLRPQGGDEHPLWADEERRVSLDAGQSFIAAEPPRATVVSGATYDWLRLIIRTADQRVISASYAFHVIAEQDRTLRQRLAGTYTYAVSRWLEVPWPTDPTRRAVELISAEPDRRRFLSRHFYWVNDWRDAPL